MADPRFFRAAGPFTVAEIAALTGATIAGAADADRRLDDVRPIESAGASHLSFLNNARYVDGLRGSSAGAVLLQPKFVDRAPASMTLLVTAKPYLAFAQAAQSFYPKPPASAGIASSAIIHPTAILGGNVTVGHHVVIAERVEIGAGTRIGPNASIDAGVVIGEDCAIGANVTLSHCLIGNRVTIYPGARIGQDGFGFAPNPPHGHVKIPQLGRVVIGDEVEIGANSTIDRGAGPDTVIGPASMIDNLVQIGHNVVMGRGCVMAAQSGISGSTRLGDFVMIGGQVGVAGHLNVGTGARIAGGSGVMRDIPPGAAVGGLPSVPMLQWHRQTATLERLALKKDK